MQDRISGINYHCVSDNHHLSTFFKTRLKTFLFSSLTVTSWLLYVKCLCLWLRLCHGAIQIVGFIFIIYYYYLWPLILCYLTSHFWEELFPLFYRYRFDTILFLQSRWMQPTIILKPPHPLLQSFIITNLQTCIISPAESKINEWSWNSVATGPTISYTNPEVSQ